MRWWRRLRLAVECLVIVVAVGTLALWCSVPNTAKLAANNPTSTAFIDLRRDEAAHAGKKWKLEWQWRPVGKISRYLRAAVVYAEDWNFYTHEGVDWDAIEGAVAKDLHHGEWASAAARSRSSSRRTSTCLRIAAWSESSASC